jgi:hypothetical protein
VTFVDPNAMTLVALTKSFLGKFPGDAYQLYVPFVPQNTVGTRCAIVGPLPAPIRTATMASKANIVRLCHSAMIK